MRLLMLYTQDFSVCSKTNNQEDEYMRTITKKLAAIGLTGILTAGGLLSALPALADGTNYTPVEGTSFTFNKYLVMEAGATTPSAVFHYTVAKGTARSADTSDNSVMQVLEGIGTPTVSDSVFRVGQAVSNAAGTSQIDVQRTDRTKVKWELAKGEKFAVSTSTVSFSGISFDEPGIYRYVITETASAEDEAKGIIHDDDKDRILDVYVTDDGKGNLVISAYVLHKNESDVVISGAMGSADVASDGVALVDKTDGFTNEYVSSDISLKKEVSGNQASRDKYFALTLELENLTAGNKYVVSLAADNNANTTDGNADAASKSNSATIAENAGKTNVTELTADASGKIRQTFYLQHGQEIAVRGLPLNASYSVTENAEDYKPHAAGVTGYQDPVSGNMAADVKTSYLNERDGIIPTGIALSAFPGMMILFGAAAGVFLILFRFRRRREEHE